MDDYLSKPLRLNELGPMLQKWLPLTGVSDLSCHANRSMQDRRQSVSVERVDLPVWDEQALSRSIGDKPEMQRRLLEKFLLNARERIAVMLAESSSADTLARSAHALKSAARTVGAMQLGELCHELETAERQVADSGRVLTGKLQLAFDAVERQIQAFLLSKNL
jgi:HPt (histidine-containing phosphotransfer) domain-containing protein